MGGEGCLEGFGGAKCIMGRFDDDWSFVVKDWLVDGWSGVGSTTISEA